MFNKVNNGEMSKCVFANMSFFLSRQQLTIESEKITDYERRICLQFRTNSVDIIEHLGFIIHAVICTRVPSHSGVDDKGKT